MDNKCCVCLNFTNDYENLASLDLLLTKLQDLVPEVEWNEDYKICQICSTELDRAYEFRQLCIRHSLERKSAFFTPPIVEIFTCYHCGSTFKDKETLVEHIYIHQQEEDPQVSPPPLDSDDFKNDDKTVLRSLYTKREPKNTKRCRTFTCEVCGVAMNQAKQIVEHCFNEHAIVKKFVKPYKCDECDNRFSSSANLIQHKKYHDGSRTHICSICGKSYITKSDLTVHEYIHLNRRNYKCEVCAKAFNTNKNLRSHMLVVHTDPTLWKHGCEVCNRRFPLKSGYEQHMKRHAGDKKFACNLCEKSFVSRSELQKHLRYHSHEKPFRCMHCDKSYKDKRLLDVHLMKLHGVGNAKVPVKERKYRCEVCTSGFSDRQKLERHMRTHAGVKPYVCVACDKKYADKYYFQRHMRSVHKVEDNQSSKVML